MWLQRSLLALLFGFSLLVASVPFVLAEDLDVKIDRMKIKEDKEDISEDRTHVSKWSQTVQERRAIRDTAQGNYDGNLKKSGAKHKLTKEAKSRLDSAERSLRRAEKRLARAQESLAENEQELTQAYQELEKDKLN